MSPPTQDQKTARMSLPTQDQVTARMSPPTQDQKTARISPPTQDQKTAECLPLPFMNALTTLRFRMRRCVLPHAEVTEQVVGAKKVDLPLPPPEVVVYAVQEEAAYHHPQLSRCCDAFPPPSRCSDVSSKPSGCCCVISPRPRTMLCALSPTQVDELTIIVQKGDQHAPPPPEGHHPPQAVQVSPSFPAGGDDICGGQVLTHEQGGLVMVSVFLLSHILRRFFTSTIAYLPYLSWQTSPSCYFQRQEHALPHDPAPHSPAFPGPAHGKTHPGRECLPHQTCPDESSAGGGVPVSGVTVVWTVEEVMLGQSGGC
jgi:hypothetical protein